MPSSTIRSSPSCSWHTKSARTASENATNAGQKGDFANAEHLVTLYKAETFPVMVFYGGHLHPLICMVDDHPYRDLIDTIIKLFGEKAANGRLDVVWNAQKPTCSKLPLTHDNAHAVLRMMQLRPGKDWLEISPAPSARS